jgi:DNA-binding GntR family transcriptional regulator
LSRLVARGLVEAEGQKGARVARASVVEITDIAAVRRDIEGLALRKSIELGDDYWESNLVAGRHRLILLERENGNEAITKETWEKRHREFHELLIAGGILYDQFDRYRNLSTEYRLSDKPVSLEHQQIMDAALARDADLAVKLLHKHIDQAAQMIVRSLPELVD